MLVSVFSPCLRTHQVHTTEVMAASSAIDHHAAQRTAQYSVAPSPTPLRSPNPSSPPHPSRIRLNYTRGPLFVFPSLFSLVTSSSRIYLISSPPHIHILLPLPCRLTPLLSPLFSSSPQYAHRPQNVPTLPPKPNNSRCNPLDAIYPLRVSLSVLFCCVAYDEWVFGFGGDADRRED